MERAHVERLEIDDADGVVVRVGDEQPFALRANREAGRLGESGVESLAVAEARFAGADPALGLAGFRVDQLEPVVVGVGDDDFLFLRPPLDAEDVLHAGFFADAVRVAEREQVARLVILAAGDGAGGAAHQVDRAHGAALAVGDEQFAVADGQAGRLRPSGEQPVGAVEVLLGAVAAEVFRDFLLEVVRPNLVCAGHGDEDLAALDEHVPRRADGLLAAALAAVVIAPLRAVAGECADGFGFRVDDAQRVVFGVGDVKVAVVKGEPLQPEKLRFVVATVGQADAAGADGVDELAVEVGDDDAVMARVADEEPFAVGINRQFAGVTQRGVDAFFVLLRRHRDGVVPENVFRVKRERGGDAGVDQLLVALAGDHQHEVALRADDGHRRPTANADPLPHVHRVVVDNRVGDLVAQHGVADVFGHFFVVELGRVHADERDGITGVTLLQLGEIRQNVNAVDAAVSPKIEHGDLAGELLGEGERRGVEPILAGGELRCAELICALIHPLDVGLELLDASGKLRAARRQIGRLAKRSQPSQGQGDRGQLGQAGEFIERGVTHAPKVPLAGGGCKSGLATAAWLSGYETTKSIFSLAGSGWPFARLGQAGGAGISAANWPSG